jgi:hypothetical protein
MWMEIVTVDLDEARHPHDHECSHLKMGSLDSNNIGDPGARGLGAAMQVNTTLMTLM